MTFEEYVKRINRLFDKHPELKDIEVYAAIDDEGNGYNQVYWNPSIQEMNEQEECVNDEDKEEGVSYKKILMVN